MAPGEGQLSVGGGEASGSDQGSRARPGTVLLVWLASRRRGNSQLVKSPWQAPASATATPRGNSQRHSCSMEPLVSVRPPDGQAPSSTAKSALGAEGPGTLRGRARSQLRSSVLRGGAALSEDNHSTWESPRPAACGGDESSPQSASKAGPMVLSHLSAPEAEPGPPALPGGEGASPPRGPHPEGPAGPECGRPGCGPGAGTTGRAEVTSAAWGFHELDRRWGLNKISCLQAPRGQAHL